MKRLLLFLFLAGMANGQVTAPPAALDNWPVANTALTLADPAAANQVAGWDNTNHKFIWVTNGAGAGGNVSNSGTPTVGQMGQWVTSTTIKGVTLSGAGGLTASIDTTGALSLSDFTHSGTGHVHGLVPDPGATTGTSKFLREDATWQTPAGGGNVSNSGTPTTGALTKWASATTLVNADLTGDVTTSGGVATTIPSVNSATWRGRVSDENGGGVMLFSGATIPDFTTGISIGGAATSRKILVGNAGGTAYIPSTETYAVPGTSGNVLTSDGTNWTSAAPTGGSGTVTHAGALTLNAVVLGNGSADTKTVTTITTDGSNTLSLGNNSIASALVLYSSGNFPTTLTTIAGAPRTVTLPNATTTLVGTNTTDVLTNKTIKDPQIGDATGTVGMRLINTGNSGVTTIIPPSTTTPRSITLPNADTTLLGASDIGVSVQAFDSDLTTWAGVTPGTGVATFLATPSSANLRAAVTDETGSGGALVFANSPAITTPTGIVKGDVGLGNVDNTSDATKNSATVILTNKQISPRIVTSSTGNTTPTPNADTTDVYVATGMTVNMAFAAPTGSAIVDGQKLIIRIKDNASARTISFATGSGAYRFSSDMPASNVATTVSSKTIWLGFIYNATDLRWDNVSQMQNF